MAKEELVLLVRKWITLDNEIKTLQKEQKKRRETKKEVSIQLMEFMKEHDVDTFDLKDGNLRYKKQNVKKPITAKALNNILNEFFEGDGEKALELNTFIMDKREKYVRETIERKIRPPQAVPIDD